MWLDAFNDMRRRSGLSLDELSEKSGVPKGTLAKITSGVTKAPALETIRSLVYAMGYTLNDLDNTGSTIKTQELSHDQRELLKNYEQLDNEGKELVKQVIDYAAHVVILNSMSKTCSLNKSTSSDNHQNIVFSGGCYPNFGLASAGQGTLAQDEPLDWSYDVNPPKGATCTITIKGDSMEPKLHDGQTVWVDTKKMVEPGQIGVFVINGNAYCKKYVLDKDGPKLVSLNPAYAPIELHEDDEIRLFGKVVF